MGREFLLIPRSIWRPEKKLTSRCTKVTELTRSLTPRVSPLSVNAKTRDVTWAVQKSQLSLVSRGRARFYNFNKSFTQQYPIYKCLYLIETHQVSVYFKTR